jgi:hypothetical protein
MSSPELENLAERRLLKREAPSAREIERLIVSGVQRLQDAGNRSNSLRGRFDLAYNAAHAVALAALWRAGYRSESRYMVFQTLEHTVELPARSWRVLARAHKLRNEMEYEGVGEPDERLTEDTIAVARTVLAALRSTSAEG